MEATERSIQPLNQPGKRSTCKFGMGGGGGGQRMEGMGLEHVMGGGGDFQVIQAPPFWLGLMVLLL